jgi:hypothetical protein
MAKWFGGYKSLCILMNASEDKSSLYEIIYIKSVNYGQELKFFVERTSAVILCVHFSWVRLGSSLEVSLRFGGCHLRLRGLKNKRGKKSESQANTTCLAYLSILKMEAT